MSRRAFPAAIVLVAALFFAPELFGNRLAVTGNLSRWLPWAETATAEQRQGPGVSLDSNLSYYPRREILHRAWRDGELPFWNPYSFCGTPFLADIQAGVLYPPNWILLPLEPGRQLGWFLFLHVAWAGIGVFLLARRCGVPPGIAWLAGVAWMLNGYFAKHYGQPTFLATVSWMPWVLYAGLGVLRRPAPGRAAGLALAGAGSFLAGQPQLAVLGAYAAAVVLAAAHFGRPREERAPVLRVGFALAAAAAVAGLVVAAQLLPTRELAANSARAELPFSAVLSGAMHPVELIRLVVPEFFGSPLTRDEWSPLFPRGDGFYIRNQMSSVFAGTPLFLLAVWGMAGPNTRRAAFPFTLLFLFSAGLTFGSPLARWAYEIAPGFRFSRIDRAGAVVVLAQIVPAALGASDLARAGGAARRGFGVASGALMLALLAVVAWRGPLLPSWLGADPLLVPPGGLGATHLDPLLPRVALAVGFGVVAATAFVTPAGALASRLPLIAGCVQLFLFAGPYRMDRRPEEVFPPQPGIETLRSVLQDDTNGGGRFVRFARDMPIHPYALSAVLPPSTNVPYGLRDLQGYNALADRRLGDALENALDENVFSHGIWAGRRIVAPERERSLEHPLMDALSVGAAVSRTGFRAAGWRPQPARGLLLQRNTEALPRVRFAAEGRGIPAAEMDARLRSGDFDPRGEILWVGEGRAGAPSGSASTLEVVRDDWNHVDIRLATETGGVLVVADTFSRGWTAAVDGRPAEILPVYGLIRGVEVPAGARSVRMAYEPPGFRLGCLLSLLGLCLAGAALALSARDAGVPRAGSGPDASRARTL